MNDRSIALIALAFSACSFILSWRSYRRAGARVKCVFNVENSQRSAIPRRFEGTSDSLAVRVRNKGMAAIQVSEIHINVGRSLRNANRGVYTLGQRIPPHDPDDVIIQLPAIVEVNFEGPAMGHVVVGLHTEKWTLNSAELFELLARPLALCDQRVRAVVVLGDGRELTSNWVGLSARHEGSRSITPHRVTWTRY